MKTCKDCPELGYETLPCGFRVYGCGKTGLVVPHSSDGLARQSEFFRVPESCPDHAPTPVREGAIVKWGVE